MTMRALLQRVNRKLKKENEMLCKARERAKRYGVGDYYKLDFYRNIISEQGVDPEELGREMRVLRPWERVVED